MCDRDRGARLLSFGSSIHQFEQLLAGVDMLAALSPFGNLTQLSGAIENGRSRIPSLRVSSRCAVSSSRMGKEGRVFRPAEDPPQFGKGVAAVDPCAAYYRSFAEWRGRNMRTRTGWWGAALLRLRDNPRAGVRRAAAIRILERKQIGSNKLFLNSGF
jgi:hypothetical protein